MSLSLSFKPVQQRTVNTHALKLLYRIFLNMRKSVYFFVST